METSECGELSSEQKLTCKWKFVSEADVLHSKSPTFGLPGFCVWRLELHKDNGASKLYFHLLSLQTDTALKVKFKATLTTDRAEPYVSTGTRDGIKQNEKCYMNFAPASRYRSVCIISVEVTILPRSSAVQRTAALHRGPCSVTEDLSVLLDSGKHWDVVLCADGTELKAHRALLSARSPVFAAMFEHDTLEAQNSRVDIDDIEPDTLRQMLRYMYTGSAAAVQQMANELLIAADKYALDGLKQLCEEELAGGLNVNNAAQTGIIALRHGSEELTRAVIDFIKQNLMSIVGTDGWCDAVTSHSKLAAEMSRLIATKSGDDSANKDIFEDFWG